MGVLGTASSGLGRGVLIGDSGRQQGTAAGTGAPQPRLGEARESRGRTGFPVRTGLPVPARAKLRAGTGENPVHPVIPVPIDFSRASTGFARAGTGNTVE